MKLCTFQAEGDAAPRVGVVRDGRIAPVDVADMRLLFAGGEEAMTRAREANGDGPALADVTLLAPIAPRKFFHTAGNFREHEEESRRVNWSHRIAPWIFFFQNVDALIGDRAPVIYPEHLTNELDYELELAVVIARAGKHFGPEEAEAYVGGYVIFNDITARDIQRREMESGVFSMCKAIDSFCPLGPWITTPDEVPDPRNLRMELSVNGELRQAGNSSRMDPSIAEVISHYSPMGYSAGDVLSLGTVAGVAGFSEDPQALYLRPGDVMEATIEHLGTLTNPVLSWEDAYGEPAPHARERVA